MEAVELNCITSKLTSYAITKKVKETMSGKTFHIHYHILYDLIDRIQKNEINYAEIGVFNGGSVSLILHHPKVTNIVGIDPLIYPGQEQCIQENIKRFSRTTVNGQMPQVTIIKKFSTDPTAVSDLKAKMGSVDILFIDGDHTFNGVVSDFEMYYQLVAPGGYIVFDDYNDGKYSPQVKPAVDEIINRIVSEKYAGSYEIIGCLNNYTEEPATSGAPYNNDYLLKVKECVPVVPAVPVVVKEPVCADITPYLTNASALPEFNDENIQFAIVIATYYRKSGATLKGLTRCLKSIENQRYKNWVVYLIGDQYENETEFASFKNLLPEGRIKMFNKPDPERNYIQEKRKLWCIAGASSMNYGLNWARKDGMKYYVHMDDDDSWNADHLLFMAHVYRNYPNCCFVNTMSTHAVAGLPMLPFEKVTSVYENNLLPRSSNLIHSSASFRCDLIKYNYHTTRNDYEVIGPSDAVMWNQINTWLQSHKQYSAVYVPALTCNHDTEGV